MKRKKFLICIATVSLLLLSLAFYVFSFRTLFFPEIKVNPYKNNPLCALVSFDTRNPSKVELTVKGKDGAKDINHEFTEYSTKHNIPVLGLYPDYQNTVIIKLTDENNKTTVKNLKIKTSPIKSNIKIEVTDKTVKNPKYHFMSDGFVFDEEGNLRLFFENKKREMIYFFNNELISENRIGGLKRYSLLGKELQKYPFPEEFTSYTHGIAQKPNGNFLVIGSYKDEKIYTNEGPVSSQCDFIIEIDYKTGEVVNKIDLGEILNPFRRVSKVEATPYGINNWCHMNGIDYDTSDESLIITCRFSGVIKIKDKTNELVWIIAPNKDFGKSGRDGKGPDISGKVLTAVDDYDIPFNKAIQQGAYSNTNFKWPTTEHNAKIYEDNILAVYDNAGKILDDTVYTTEKSNASIYKIDEEKKTLKQIWFMPLGLFSPCSSSITYDSKDKDVTVFSESVWYSDKLTNDNILVRYDFDTQEVLFASKLHYNHKISYLYKHFPFRFYPERE